MGQDPQLIRQQIEETRADMDETIGAIGYKADVKERAKENVQGKVDAVTGRVSAVKDKVVGQASELTDHAPSGEEIKSNARQAASVAQENPLGLAIGAVAVGFLGGLLIPTTRLENEKIGPVADQLKEQAQEAGQTVVDRGKEVASEAVHAAQDAASGSISQQPSGAAA